MMENLSGLMSTKKIGIITIIGLALLILCSSASIQRQPKPGDLIVGTWISTQGGATKWVFTKYGSKTRTYYKGELDETFTYSISRTATHCGVDMSERLRRYPDESILVLSNSESDKKRCYLVQNLTKDTLVLRFFGSANFLIFRKQE